MEACILQPFMLESMKGCNLETFVWDSPNWLDRLDRLTVWVCIIDITIYNILTFPKRKVSHKRGLLWETLVSAKNPDVIYLLFKYHMVLDWPNRFFFRNVQCESWHLLTASLSDLIWLAGVYQDLRVWSFKMNSNIFLCGKPYLVIETKKRAELVIYTFLIFNILQKKDNEST